MPLPLGPRIAVTWPSGNGRSMEWRIVFWSVVVRRAVALVTTLWIWAVPRDALSWEWLPSALQIMGLLFGIRFCIVVGGRRFVFCWMISGTILWSIVWIWGWHDCYPHAWSGLSPNWGTKREFMILGYIVRINYYYLFCQLDLSAAYVYILIN